MREHLFYRHFKVYRIMQMPQNDSLSIKEAYRHLRSELNLHHV